MLSIAALAVAFTAAGALAQPQSGATASSPAGSGPRMGKGGMGMGGGGMQGHRMRADAGNTSGWGMMTPKEREEHRSKMMAMKSPEECKAYMAKHHEEMVARAKERGVNAPDQPRHDMCAGMN